MADTAEVYYDPYDVEINADPYPAFKALRENAPVYYNEPHDFFAVSLADDVERSLVDRDHFSNARSDVLEFIKAGVEFPSGILIFEDPPLHTIHRGLLSSVFTPRKMAALEPQIREFCAHSLDPLVGTGEFDFVHDLGAPMPMRVTGMLVGIPDSEQQALRDKSVSSIATEPGQPMDSIDTLGGEMFSDYYDFRLANPSDDIMTELQTVQFEDEHGVTRTLTREEVLTYIAIVAGAGNETTTKLIGWAGKVLAAHPDQRRELAKDFSLIPDAIEELLRYEPPGPHVARYVTKDAEFDGGLVPAGSALLCLVGSANRDPSRFPDPDRFDIHRKPRGHLTFSVGAHFCMGAALARLEGRIALEEVLKRFPEWAVDEAKTKFAVTSTVRGWESLPVSVPA
ncbi:MAG TPA: cytochrome P450 [Mycobacteriales bacterium]|nr:cytochrome P450 [Mycobacteriales bacterium]